MSKNGGHTIALIGLGTIGLSFAAMHLRDPSSKVRLYDVRPDLKEHIASLLPIYLRPRKDGDSILLVDEMISTGRITLCSSLEDVCAGATIVQEQGPETLQFKKATWSQVVQLASSIAHLWTATSGILPSKQSEDLKTEDRSRLVVVHPFNPPHLTPLIEIVPSPYTDPRASQFAKDYIDSLQAGYSPVILKKEIPGFVGNRLAFALFREACYLVANDVVSVQDLDKIMEASHGPRWSISGPFKLWNLAGGPGGLGEFCTKLGETIDALWKDMGTLSFSEGKLSGGYPGNPITDQTTAQISEVEDTNWLEKVVRQTSDAYGLPTPDDFEQRDADLKRILKVSRDIAQ